MHSENRGNHDKIEQKRAGDVRYIIGTSRQESERDNTISDTVSRTDDITARFDEFITGIEKDFSRVRESIRGKVRRQYSGLDTGSLFFVLYTHVVAVEELVEMLREKALLDGIRMRISRQSGEAQRGMEGR